MTLSIKSHNYLKQKINYLNYENNHFKGASIVPFSKQKIKIARC